MDWQEVKPKQKKKRKPQAQEETNVYGGISHGHLKSGPVYHAPQNPSSNVTKSASAVADFDPLKGHDEDEEIKYETISHECAVAVANARAAKKLT